MKPITSSLGLAAPMNKLLSSLGKAPATPKAVFAAAPSLRRPADSLTPEMGRRLLLFQILASMMESNATELLNEGSWENKDLKLMNAVMHRIGELYDRYFERNNASQVDFLNPVTRLSEAAVISILAVATQGNTIKNQRLTELIAQLAILAGTYQDDSTSNAA